MRKKDAKGVAVALAAATLIGCGGGGGGGEEHPCDLAALSVDIPDGTYDPAHSLNVSCSARNYGPEDCASYTVAFFLSSDIFIGGVGDKSIGSYSRTGGLASGATDSDSLLVSWTGVAPGVYYVGMTVTYADDWNLSNNTACDFTPITISPGGVSADLYDRGDTFSDFGATTVSPGDAWNAGCDVGNSGDGDAGAFSVAFYASLDETITTSDQFLGSVLVSSGVSVGSFADADLVLSSFPAILGGTYYVGWIIDAGDVVFESNETNNTAHEAAYTLTVIAGPDLEVTLVNATDGTHGTTDSLSVLNSTYNNGPDACTGYTVNFYLSTDTTIDVSDDLIGTSVRGSLAVSGTHSTSNTGSWSSVAPGDYYVGMIITCASDYDTSNNTGYDATPITISLDGYEPNDIQAEAYYLGMFTNTFYVDALIDPSGDEDWFYVYETGGWILTIDLTNLPANYDLYLYDSVGTEVATSKKGGTAAERIVFTCTSSGNWYIQVVGVAGAFDGVNPYSLTVEVP